jgi:hypothetical protein
MITGHSMGGAMASFCALDLVVSTEHCLKCILFKLKSLFLINLCSIPTFAAVEFACGKDNVSSSFI